MSILINNDTKLVVQGITGKEGTFHTCQMLDYGTQITAGVTPGKGGGKMRMVFQFLIRWLSQYPIQVPMHP